MVYVLPRLTTQLNAHRDHVIINHSHHLLLRFRSTTNLIVSSGHSPPLTIHFIWTVHHRYPCIVHIRYVYVSFLLQLYTRVQCVEYVHCTLYSVQCTLYTVHLSYGYFPRLAPYLRPFPAISGSNEPREQLTHRVNLTSDTDGRGE